MEHLSFTGLFVVALIAVGAPIFVTALRLRIPAPVIEIDECYAIRATLPAIGVRRCAASRIVRRRLDERGTGRDERGCARNQRSRRVSREGSRGSDCRSIPDGIDMHEIRMISRRCGQADDIECFRARRSDGLIPGGIGGRSCFIVSRDDLRCRWNSCRD